MSLLGGKALFRNGHPKDTIVPRKRAPVAQSRVLNRIWGTDQPDRADEFEGQSTKGAALGRESEKADPNRRRRGVPAPFWASATGGRTSGEGRFPRVLATSSKFVSGDAIRPVVVLRR